MSTPDFDVRTQIVVPIPLGQDRFAWVTVPRDVTVEEATRIAEVVKTLGVA